jgi:hypothetical protein
VSVDSDCQMLSMNKKCLRRRERREYHSKQSPNDSIQETSREREKGERVCLVSKCVCV